MENKRKSIVFYCGLVIMVVLSVFITNRAIVSSGAIRALLIGKFSLYSILIVLPISTGLVYMFNIKKSLIAKIFVILGLLLLVLALITSVLIAKSKFSIIQYIIFPLVYIGAGVLIVMSLKNNKENENVK